MNLEKQVQIRVSVLTLATMIAGLYSVHTQINIMAISTELFIELANQLLPYLEEWDYDKITFERWIQDYLLIYPADMFSAVEYNEAKRNPIFIERNYGNVILIATARFGD